MNATLLLEHYARIADAPDATVRLRRFILDLAVRGKLLEQDPSDEPASELLKRIASQKTKGSKKRPTSAEGHSEAAQMSVMPFSIPASWAWCGATYPAEQVSDVGKKVQTKDVLASGRHPVVDQGKIFIRGYCDDDEKLIRVGIPVVVFGDHTRETKLVDFDFIVGADGVKILKPISIQPAYYYLCLSWLPLDSRGYGRHFKLLREAEIPLPPLAEQHRIVAKVDELMALCDQLEAARTMREADRDKLTAASLARLNAPDPETFATDARFALDNLASVTTRADQIKHLRRTILNLAVRGMLVEQDANDEPAAELLKRIAAKKAQLIKVGEIRRDKQLDRITAADLPFALPDGWAWARFGSLIHLVSGQHLQPLEYSEDPAVGLPYITGPSDFGSDGLQISRFALVRKAVAKHGQLLLTVKGSGVGKTTTCNISEVAISRQLMALTAIGWERRYLVLMTHRLAEVLQESARSLIPGISREDVECFVVAVPPLAEQCRIVAKVDELMALCNQLEAGLNDGEQTRSRLLEAVLHDALEPA